MPLYKSNAITPLRQCCTRAYKLFNILFWFISVYSPLCFLPGPACGPDGSPPVNSRRPSPPSSPDKSSLANTIARRSASSDESGQYCNLGLPRGGLLLCLFQSKVRGRAVALTRSNAVADAYLTARLDMCSVAFPGGVNETSVEEAVVCSRIKGSVQDSHNPLSKPPSHLKPTTTTTFLKPTLSSATD